MPLSQNFNASQTIGEPSIIGLTDTSTGSDTLVKSRRVYLQKYDGTYLTESPQQQYVAEVRATATITIGAIGNNGDNIEILVNDPVKGSISLGSYTKVSGDTTTTILAASIATALSANTDGYGISSLLNVITVTAPVGYGDSINGGGRFTATANTTPETKARVLFNSMTLRTTGDLITVKVELTPGVYTELANYTQTSGDTTLAILLGNIISAINANTGVNGYSATTINSTSFYLIAAPGLGASINGISGYIFYPGGATSSTFSGGVTGVAIISNSLTQFANGADATTTSVTGVDWWYWASADSSISIDTLDKDYALSIIVQWLNAANAVLYTKTILYGFTLYNEQELYELTQYQTSNPQVISDTNYYANKSRLRSEIDAGDSAIAIGGDIASAQYAYDRATAFRINGTFYF